MPPYKGKGCVVGIGVEVRVFVPMCVKIFHYVAHGRLVIALMMIIAVVMVQTTLGHDDDNDSSSGAGCFKVKW